MAPPMARNLSIPSDNISRKAPSREMNSQVAGLFPVISRLYSPWVQSPSEDGMKEVVGIPPNIESVHRAGSSG